MISGLNDSDAQGQELAGKLKGILSHVNLIPVNDVTGNHYKKFGAEAACFAVYLKNMVLQLLSEER